MLLRATNRSSFSFLSSLSRSSSSTATSAGTAATPPLRSPTCTGSTVCNTKGDVEYEKFVEKHFGPGFSSHKVTVEYDGGKEVIQINAVKGGRGPPLLLLHSFPQDLMMWRKVAPKLADYFTVVCPDMKGCGRSSKPAFASEFEGLRAYSKRALARDNVAVMKAFGYYRFNVAGANRGARVAHRLALDHPSAVHRLAILQIIPTTAVLNQFDRLFAETYWHWFFLAQKNAEQMISRMPEEFMNSLLNRIGTDMSVFEEEILAHYCGQMKNKEVVKAACLDYRAGLTLDAQDDLVDSMTRIKAPLLCLFGADGPLKDKHVAETWRQKADDVTVQQVQAAHFLAEEAPAETARLLSEFFRSRLADWHSYQDVDIS